VHLRCLFSVHLVRDVSQRTFGTIFDFEVNVFNVGTAINSRVLVVSGGSLARDLAVNHRPQGGCFWRITRPVLWITHISTSKGCLI
jgi:hypothetical protein